LRDNGAIEGAAAGFSVGSNVIILKRNDNDVIKVIGHVGGKRRCDYGKHYYSVSHSSTGDRQTYRMINGVWTLDHPGLYKVTDKYLHVDTSAGEANLSGIYKRDGSGLQQTIDWNTIWGVQSYMYDIHYSGTAASLRFYSVYYEDGADLGGNRDLLINGVSTGKHYACIHYARGKLYGIHGTSSSGPIRGADRVDEMNSDGVLEKSYTINSLIRFENYRNHIRYDSKNDCFYLIGENGGLPWFGSGYTYICTCIEKYTSDWKLVYRRYLGAWDISSSINTIWQGEGWIEGQDFYSGMINTHVRYPSMHLYLDVYDDKLFVMKHTEELVDGGQQWVPSEIKSLDLITYPIGDGISALPYGTWLESVSVIQNPGKYRSLNYLRREEVDD